MTLSTLFVVALIILAAVGVFYLFKLAFWLLVFRPIYKALKNQSFADSLGDTWGESDQFNKLWWFPSLYEN